jgi:hypothetical protein
MQAESELTGRLCAVGKLGPPKFDIIATTRGVTMS